MNLHVHDALKPFPEEFRGIYDVVHVRFFVSVIEKGDLARFIGNLMGLLSELSL